jgi:hypothetical protein
LAADAWRHIFGLRSAHDYDADHRSCIPGLTRAAVKKAVDDVFAEMECAGHGVIDIDALNERVIVSIIVVELPWK